VADEVARWQKVKGREERDVISVILVCFFEVCFLPFLSSFPGKSETGGGEKKEDTLFVRPILFVR
jgi:hypothetical protein